MMPTIQEICEEISIINEFLAQTDDSGEKIILDIIQQPLVEALQERLNMLGQQTIPETIIEIGK